MTGVVEFEVDGEAGRLRGYDDLVVVSLQSVTAGRRLYQSVAMRGGRAGERLARTFERTGVTVDIRVCGVSVARLGPGSTAGVLDRRLSERLGVPASLSLGGVVRSLLR